MTIEEALHNINNYETTPTDVFVLSCHFMIDTKYTNGVDIMMVEELIKKYDLKVKNRRQNKRYPRFYLMAYLHENTRLSLTYIGNLFNRNHSTVLHAVRQHNDLMSVNDSIYKKYIEDIKKDVDNL